VVSKGTKYKSLFKKMGFLIDGYHKWDLFRHQEALDTFVKAKIEELVEIDDKQIRLFAKATEDRIDFLIRIIKEGKKSSVSFILDVYSNAERRYEEGKIDDAILRLYRLVEMMAQERLSSQFNIDPSNVLPEQIPQPLQNGFIKDYRSKRDGKIKIPQTAAFELLYSLNDNLGKLFREKKQNFLDIQSSRNYSYLAHGFQSAKESTFLKLRDFLLGLKVFRVDDAPIFPKFEI
jgi:CRISPR-associated protein (TIGR02710 family)